MEVDNYMKKLKDWTKIPLATIIILTTIILVVLYISSASGGGSGGGTYPSGGWYPGSGGVSLSVGQMSTANLDSLKNVNNAHIEIGCNYKGAGSWSDQVDIGSYTTSFGSATGCTIPSSQTVNVNAGQATYVTPTYAQDTQTSTPTPVPKCTPNWACAIPLTGYEYDKNDCGGIQRPNPMCNPTSTPTPVPKCTPNWACAIPLTGYEYDKNDCGGIQRPNPMCNPTSTPTYTPIVTTPVVTYTPIVTTPVVTYTPIVTTPVMTRDRTVRIGPTVNLRPVKDDIIISEDGLIELYIDNPVINEEIMHADVKISVPSGISMNGQGFGNAESAGILHGVFDIYPGQAITIQMTIKAEKTGEFLTKFSGLYWLGDNKNNYQPISLTHTIKVREIPEEEFDIIKWLEKLLKNIFGMWLIKDCI